MVCVRELRFAGWLVCLLLLSGAAHALQGIEVWENPEQEPPRRAHSPRGEEERNSDPVFLATGEFHLEEVDLRIPGPGIDFIWKRSYRARTALGGPMGHRWHHSYDIKLERDYSATGVRYVLTEGSGRRTGFENNGGSHDFPSSGSPSLLQYNYDGDSATGSGPSDPTLTWPNQVKWYFFDPGTFENPDPLDGRLSRIEDPNGNVLTLNYNSSSGKLTSVDCTNGVRVDLGYDANGRIDQLSYLGRTIGYSYYTSIDNDGSDGDLKSVTSPSVVGTPNGNDFPAGKTRTYKYNAGEQDDVLNHYLIEVVEPDGRRSILNTYELATDSLGGDYYRVSSQAHGDGIFNYTYHAVDDAVVVGQPDESVQLTIINDRMGNVRHHYYTQSGALYKYREYTGRAQASRPTTLALNLPSGKLRVTDPDFYETRYEFDGDFNVGREFFPGGDEISYVYDAANASPLSRGNLLQKTRHPGAALGGNQAQLTESWEYHPKYNAVTKYTPPKGAAYAVTYEYFDTAPSDNGNRKSITYPIVTAGTCDGLPQAASESFEYFSPGGQVKARVWPGGRRDEYTYGPGGYLASKVVDVGGFALLTTYDYDSVGNLVAETDPRGAVTRTVYNELNQRMRAYSAVSDQLPGFSPSFTDYTYDANDNVVCVDVRNLDQFDVVAANEFITSEYEYDVLGNTLVRRREISEDTPGTVVWSEERYTYDANENLTRTELPEYSAAPGDEYEHSIEKEYDERDLLFRFIRAPHAATQSTDEYSYDANRHLVKRVQGVENTTDPRVTTWFYDGFDRQRVTTDAEGNERLLDYDEHGNIIHEVVMGEALEGAPGSSTNNVVLRDISYSYDARDRQVSVTEDWFDLSTGNTVGDGSRITSTGYNLDSQVVCMTDDNGHASEIAYDSVRRRKRATDALNNTTDFAYDGASNLISVTLTEFPVGPSGVGSPVISTTSSQFDLRERVHSTTDADGQVATFAYDSRSQLVESVDRRGNTSRITYDGLGRRKQQEFDLRMGGTGSGAVEQTDTIGWEWDRASRLTARIDGEGNRTEHDYDELSRRTKTTFADGTEQTWIYDVHGNVTSSTDPNGTVVHSEYDRLNRLVSRPSIVGDPSVLDTTWETYRYDGRSHVVHGSDDDSSVDRAYDSLGNLLSEDLSVEAGPTATTSFAYDGVGNILETVYPNSRSISAQYDDLNQLHTLHEGSVQLATYWWEAPGRLGSIERANGASTVYGYDSIWRMNHVRHDGAAGILSEYALDWDEEGNKKNRSDLQNGYSYDFSYDSLNRMVESTNDNPAFGNITYELDRANNRESRTVGTVTGSYTLDSTTPVPADAQVNQYTKVPAAAGVEHGMVYDANGNLTARTVGGIPKRTLEYDYRNQMVSFGLPNNVTHLYSYDVFGRRVGKTLNSQGATPNRFVYAYAGSQVVEELTAGGASRATYVLGAYLDQPLAMQSGGLDYYYHADDQGSVLALTGSSGALVERYDYADFGRPLDGDTFTSMPDSAVGNPYYFTGRRRDNESKWYYYRTRYFVPKWGRFTTRDTIGIWGDASNRGNGLTYTNNNPWSRRDPTGQSDGPGFWDTLEFGWDMYFGNSTGNAVVDQLAAPAFQKMVDKEIDDLQAKAEWAGVIPPLGLVVDATSAAVDTVQGQYGEALTTAGLAAGGILADAARGLSKADEVVGAVKGSGAADDVAGAAAKNGDEAASGAKNAAGEGSPSNTGDVTDGPDGTTGTGNGPEVEPGKGEGPEDTGATGSTGVPGSVPSKPSTETIDSIADGHAWHDYPDRWDEYEIYGPEGLAEHIDDVVSNPTDSKALKDGRAAFWDERTDTIVITDPGNADGGTAYPGTKAIYDDLK